MLGVVIGIGLAASCGFRVFVPLLVTSAAAMGGYIELADGFSWIGTWTAFAAFAAAALIEIAAYYVPLLDNMVDTIASPLSVIAGVILFAASVTDLDPFLHWSLAIIAGGGAAGVVQGGTVATRTVSTAGSGGLTNFLVSTFEAIAGFIFSVLSIVVPVIALFLLLLAVCAMYFVGRRIIRAVFVRPAT